VICGELKPRKRVNLFVFDGGSGRMLKMVVMPLTRRNEPGPGALESAVPKLEVALSRIAVATTPAAAGSRPGWRMGAAVAPGNRAASDAALDGLLGRLSSQLPAERLAALAGLARQRHWRAMIPMACTLMNDGSSRVRAAATGHVRGKLDSAILTGLRIAAELEGDQALRARIQGILAGTDARLTKLAAQLKSPAAQQRLAAAQALQGCAHTGALAPMIQAAKDTDPGVRLAALEGLRNFSQPGARLALSQARRDTDPRVSALAARAVKERQRLSAWRAFYNSYPRIMKKTRSREPAWRAEAAVALGINGAEMAVQRLEQMLRRDSSEVVRLAAGWSLAVLGGPRSVKALLEVSTSDRSPRVRRGLARYLKPGEGPAIAGDDAEAREHAAAAVGLRPAGAAKRHLARAALCDPAAAVRAAALQGLARDGSELSLGTLRLAIFRDPSDEVRRVAMMMYVLVGWKDEGPATAQVTSKETAAWEGKDAEVPEDLTKKPAAGETPVVRKQAEPPTPRCPAGCRALRLRAGPSMLFTRDFGVDNPDRNIDTIGMTSTPVAGFAVGAEVYPAAWWTRGWLANVGLGFGYQRYFGLSWKADNELDTSHAITFQTWSIDFLRLRYQPVRGEALPTLYLRFGIRHQDVLMNDEEPDAGAHIPDLSATSVDLGLAARIPVGFLDLSLGFDYLPVTSWGEIVESPQYGEGGGWGLMATAGLGGQLSERIELAAEARYTRYAVSFDRSPDAQRKADGAVDQYVSGLLSLIVGL
jgi:HEAT repeat protein